MNRQCFLTQGMNTNVSLGGGNEDGCSLAAERCTEPERGDVQTDLPEIDACLLRPLLQYVAATTYQTEFTGAYVSS